MKTIVLVLGVLSVVLLIALRLYVIWLNKQPFSYQIRNERYKRHSRIRQGLANFMGLSFSLFFISLIVWGIMWLWTNADVRVFVF